jgi:octaprenyl-diphosphate synthase
MRDYGLHLGIAFQMVDDQLDYLGTPTKLGKNIGDDLAEGKVTLPLIVAMRNGQPHQKAFVENAIRTGGVENLPEMLQLVNATGALNYTYEQANKQRCQAMGCLNNVADSEFKDSMSTLVNFVVDRHH